MKVKVQQVQMVQTFLFTSHTCARVRRKKDQVHQLHQVHQIPVHSDLTTTKSGKRVKHLDRTRASETLVAEIGEELGQYVVDISTLVSLVEQLADDYVRTDYYVRPRP